MSEICIIVTIVVYLAAMLLVGFAYSKTNNDSTDFYLGGRKMGPLVTAMSAEASDMSSWLLMGMPGLAYLTGIASPGWTAIGLALGTWLNWLIVARRLRRYSANLDAITVPQFLSLRFHDQRNLLNALGAVIIIVFFVPYTASGFAACGKLFHSLFGVDYMAAMLVSALVIVGYTILGGFRAVTTTDLIQSVVMSLALIAVLGYGIVVAGGWGAVVENAQSLSGYLTMTASHDAVTGGAASYSLLDIVSTMAWGLGYFGMPHILLRFMAIEDEKKLVLSRRIATVWVVISMFIAVLIGIVAQYGLQGVFFACFAAGVLLLAAGLLKLGRLIGFIPMPVIMGFTSGIAIIIALGQVDNFFGTVSEGSSNLEKLASYARLGFHPNLQTVLIGALVVAVMLVWPKKWGAKIPGSLIGIIAATALAAVLDLDELAVVGDIPRTLLLSDRLHLGSLSLDMLSDLISPVVTIAALGMIESLSLIHI